MDKDPQKEKAALESYAAERALMNSPYDESYDQKTEADPRFKILFQLDLVDSVVWTGGYLHDLCLYLRSHHAVLGLFSHHLHPLTLRDRIIIILCGFCMATGGALFPACESLCFDDCSDAYNTSVCDDGGFPSGDGLCDFGHDCTACGVRDEIDFREYEGIYCYNWTEGIAIFFIWAFGTAIYMLLLRQFIMCNCCRKQYHGCKQCGDHFSAITSGLLLTASVLFALYVILVWGISVSSVFMTKLIAYILGLVWFWIVFHYYHQGELKDIHEAGGMKQYILSSRSLDSILKDVTDVITNVSDAIAGPASQDTPLLAEKQSQGAVRITRIE